MLSECCCGKVANPHFPRWVGFGAQIIDADRIAREIVDKGKPALKEIENHFGPDVLNHDGTLNREKMGKLVFGNEKARNVLNDITHPKIFSEINTLIEKFRGQGAEIVIIEAALILERDNIKKIIDELIVVSASQQVQVERIKNRDGLSEKEAIERINSQMPTEQKIKHADYVIYNDQDLDNVRKQVADIWARINQKLR